MQRVTAHLRSVSYMSHGAKTIVELEDLSDGELVGQHDELAGPSEGRGVDWGEMFRIAGQTRTDYSLSA